VTVINKHRASMDPPKRRNIDATIRAQGRWVAVAVDPEPEMIGFIVIPDNAKNQVKAIHGRIVSMGGEAAKQLYRVYYPPVSCGDRVVIDWYKAPGGVALDDGVPFRINGESIRFVDVDQVLAVEE